MAQLNPNFEIDFSDINSYEQIQLINDTQLAKENLLMHRAYKEPSDDEIIRNHFSSFTFVDFCPKVYTRTIPSSANSSVAEEGCNRASGTKLKHYELETFSDLFERINRWLKSNKDWRVVSMETLVYDCTTQFNHLKSSIYSNYLPQNTRGLRLFLSPSKSRFSGPQKIGCINVVPRKISGSYLTKSTATLSSTSSSTTTSSSLDHSTKKPKAIVDDDNSSQQTIAYETLDQILQRLNELLLTRPIEGRILSVETITLPMVGGYVNTESNYFMDSRLNILNQTAYSIPTPPQATQSQQTTKIAETLLEGHCLIDILRVYYEFGPMTCGLVNIIDFLPRFYSPTTTMTTLASSSTCEASLPGGFSGSTTPAIDQEGRLVANDNTRTTNNDCDLRVRTEKIPTTESLTRLIRRSLSWFESERKRIIEETGSKHYHNVIFDNNENDYSNVNAAFKVGCVVDEGDERSKISSIINSNDRRTNNGQKCNISSNNGVDLKVCNLQVHQNTLLKGQLIQLKPSNIQQIINTRRMAHERCDLNQLFQPIIATRKSTSCDQCSNILANSKNNDNRNLNLTNEQLEACLMRCPHLYEFGQAYQVKFVRLAYIVPVNNKYSIKTILPNMRWPIQITNRNKLLKSARKTLTQSSSSASDVDSDSHLNKGNDDLLLDENSIVDAEEMALEQEQEEEEEEEEEDFNDTSKDDTASNASSTSELSSTTTNTTSSVELEDKLVKSILLADGKEEECAALKIVKSTNERHRKDEDAHQFNEGAGDTAACAQTPTGTSAIQMPISSSADKQFEGSLIGQLTYRLFAPCQLVSSSSCFSINPVNTSNPLARRGSVDLNSSGSNNLDQSPIATTSTTSLLKCDNNNHQITNQQLQQQQQQQQQPMVTSFGAFFPALSHDPIQSISSSVASSFFGAENYYAQSNHNNNKHYTNNEFESVEAIRRRMEIYVTTNSMKVIAGETLIVNLSDSLSCLSTAIEQTIVRASFAHQRAPSTWVSVYVLYAAVDEPLLPSQLLAQQKLRELTLINEEHEGDDNNHDNAAPINRASNEEEEMRIGANENLAKGSSCFEGPNNINSIFDDEFKNELTSDNKQQKPSTNTSSNNKDTLHSLGPIIMPEEAITRGSETTKEKNAKYEQQISSLSNAVNTKLNVTTTNDGIRIEQNSIDSNITLYNSAYDRTVALPTQPDNNISSLLEPIEFVGSQADSMWLNENDLIEAQYNQHLLTGNICKEERRKLKKKLGRRINNKKIGEDSQCSIM